MNWNLKEIVFDIIGVGSFAFMAWLFANFWIRGEFYVGEPNLLIRTLETIFIGSGLLLGFERFFKDLKSRVL